MSTPIVTLYPNGVSMARIHAGNPPGVKRGQTTGWNSHTSARFRKWLMSIDVESLTSAGNVLWGFTLTIAETPRTAEDWARIRETFTKRVDRRLPGCNWVWLTEFQRRGTPHLHGVIVAPKGAKSVVERLCYTEWPEIASKGATKHTRGVAQYVTPLYDASGWLQYMTKHLSRGQNHYQRSKLPEGWTKSGRIYGYNRGWPVAETRFQLSQAGWFQLRRIMHSWAMGDAAKMDLPDRVRRQRYLKAKKRAGGRETSEFVGSSEWMPPAVYSRLVTWLLESGYFVLDYSTGEVINWEPARD